MKNTIYSEILDVNKSIYSIKKDGETIGHLRLNSGKYLYIPFPDTIYDLETLKNINDIIKELEGKTWK